MGHDPTVYDYLTGQTISSTTISQLVNAGKDTFVDQSNIEYWSGLITLNRVLEASRTYPHGQPIPGASAITGQPVFPEQTAVFQPEGNENWQILGIEVQADAGTPSIVLQLTDGANTCTIHSEDATTTKKNFFPWESPLPINNGVYLAVYNADVTNGATVVIAFHKVGL